MADENHDDDAWRSRLERMRQLLTPISEERAREIGDKYTRHMREAVERTRQQQGSLDTVKTDDRDI
jgi:hypothetical protein